MPLRNALVGRKEAGGQAIIVYLHLSGLTRIGMSNCNHPRPKPMGVEVLQSLFQMSKESWRLEGNGVDQILKAQADL